MRYGSNLRFVYNLIPLALACACSVQPATSEAALTSSGVAADYATIAAIPQQDRVARVQFIAPVTSAHSITTSMVSLTVSDQRNGKVVASGILALVSQATVSEPSGGAGTAAKTTIATMVSLVDQKGLTRQGEPSGLSLAGYKPLNYNWDMGVAKNRLTRSQRAACLRAPAPKVIPATPAQLAGNEPMPIPDPNAPWVTAYRGVPAYSPSFDDALQGNAQARDLTANVAPDDHVGNMGASNLMSWTLAPDVADVYTMGSGVIIKAKFPQSSIKLLSPGHSLGEDSPEQQILVPNRVEGGYPIEWPCD